jgi:hypothetical protein
MTRLAFLAAAVALPARREGTLRSYSNAVAALFARQSGMDLRALRLTRAGFAARRRPEADAPA